VGLQVAGLLCAVAVCGCAGLPPAAGVDSAAGVLGASSEEGDGQQPADAEGTDLEQSLRAYLAASSSEQLARRRSLRQPEARGPARVETTRIASPPSVEEHVGSRRRIDVKLHQADLTEALRFIAHSGGINLVVGQGVVGQVNVELRRVTAFAALRAIAQAHGARIVHAE